MKVDVKFVNFPVSEAIRNLVAGRIEHQIEKYGEGLVNARAVFSVEGFVHHCRLSVAGAEWKMSVAAADADMGRSVDMAIDKLGGAMRRASQRRKLKRTHQQAANLPVVRGSRQRSYPIDNAFDRFEDEFVREFEETFEKAV